MRGLGKRFSKNLFLELSHKMWLLEKKNLKNCSTLIKRWQLPNRLTSEPWGISEKTMTLLSGSLRWIWNMSSLLVTGSGSLKMMAPDGREHKMSDTSNF